MKNTIGTIICLMFMFISVELMAQDPIPKVQEFGIGLSNLNSFSLQYLWGNENRLSRLTLSLGMSTLNSVLPKQISSINDTTQIESHTTQTTPININGALNYSILKIKPLTDKFGLVYGSIFSLSGLYVLTKTTGTSQEYLNGNLSVTSSSSWKNTVLTLQPSIGFVLGAVYAINTSFSIYAEIDPNLYYKHDATSNGGNSRFNTSSNSIGLASLSNSGATVTLVYKFEI